MRIGYDHKNRLLVADGTEALGHLLIEVAYDRVAHDGPPHTLFGGIAMNRESLLLVKAAALDILDELHADLLAAEVTMDDLG